MKLKFFVLPLALGAAAVLGACQPEAGTSPSDPAASPEAGGMESPANPAADPAAPSPGAEAPPGG